MLEYLPLYLWSYLVFAEYFLVWLLGVTIFFLCGGWTYLEVTWIQLMDMTISKLWATVFLFETTRCLWVSTENCQTSGKLLENLWTDHCEAQTTIISGTLGTHGRNQGIFFHPYPSITHKKVRSLWHRSRVCKCSRPNCHDLSSEDGQSLHF